MQAAGAWQCCLCGTHPGHRPGVAMPRSSGARPAGQPRERHGPGRPWSDGPWQHHHPIGRTLGVLHYPPTVLAVWAYQEVAPQRSRLQRAAPGTPQPAACCHRAARWRWVCRGLPQQGCTGTAGSVQRHTAVRRPPGWTGSLHAQLPQAACPAWSEARRPGCSCKGGNHEAAESAAPPASLSRTAGPARAARCAVQRAIREPTHSATSARPLSATRSKRLKAWSASSVAARQSSREQEQIWPTIRLSSAASDIAGAAARQRYSNKGAVRSGHDQR